jgi:ubiquinone/menaquinone biosynthesis C-methylase UbiE
MSNTTEAHSGGTATWLTRAREIVRFSSLLLNRSRKRADLLYDLVSTGNYLTERTLYRNVGYWKNAPATLDDACEALAQLAGERLELGPSDRLLDVGFGYGDQDMYWVDRFGPREIVGLNITRSQLDQAEQRVTERGLSDRITFMLAPATDMPFEANSFDKVVALESAFHFQTRDDFFREAFRVLKPGGRLVTLDILPQSYDDLALLPKMISSIGLHLWQTCAENLYSRHVYADKLRIAGFDDARVETIFEHTMVPFARYTLAELSKPEASRRINPAVAAMMSFPARVMLDNPLGLLNLDYVLAVANKPS